MIWERMSAGISDFVSEFPLYVNGYKASGERNTLRNRLFLWLEVWYCGAMSLLFFIHDPIHLRFAFVVSLPFLAVAVFHALYVEWGLNWIPNP